MFKKINQNRMYEEIASQLIEAILRGDLRPNDKLQSEGELCDVFGVSRVTIREAIRSLEQIGVIEVRQGPKGGSYIKKMDMDVVAVQIEKILQVANMTMEQLSEVRAILEEVILTRLIHMTDSEEDVKRLEQTIIDAEKYLKEGNDEKRLAANIKFHTIIAEMTGNPLIILMHKVTMNMLFYCFTHIKPSVSMGKQTIRDHRRIVSFLQKHDFRRASEVCADHVQQVGKRFVRKSKGQSVIGKKAERKR